ncbi:MAG: Bacteriophage protein of unknown function [Herbinix sp.]|nr:Bacteriophage protein of unknown function [Herbinix sp.]
MSDLGFELKGFEELQQKLSQVVKKYPDLAEERLESTGKGFKKRVVEVTRQRTSKHSGNLVKGFRLDKIKGYGMNMSKDFRGTAPHFHLIENGHNQVTKDGKKVGWVQGKHIVKDVRDEYQEIIPEVMQELYDDIVRECNLND